MRDPGEKIFCASTTVDAHCRTTADAVRRGPRAVPRDEVTWTTKSWLQKHERISVVLHTAIAEQIVNELGCGEGGRVHGAKLVNIEGADRELRKSEDATHFATDGPRASPL